MQLILSVYLGWGGACCTKHQRQNPNHVFQPRSGKKMFVKEENKIRSPSSVYSEKAGQGWERFSHYLAEVHLELLVLETNKTP